MSPRAAPMGHSGPRHTPPKLDELTRKKRKLTNSLNLLTSELPALEKRRDDAAASSLNGGGSRAEREYKKLVEQLAEKANEKSRLQHAITGLDAQLTDERERIEAVAQARKAEQEATHREKCIRLAMRRRKDILEHRLPHCVNEHERAEINLQLDHLREIAETEYDDEAKMREWGKPKPLEMVDGRPVSSPRPQPQMTQMVIHYGLPPRPRDLGEKK